jgi:cytoskeletal protein CcmA (bactofilin family)
MIFKRSKPAPPRPSAIAAEPSYIARDTTVEGNVVSEGEVHIDGSVQGMVRAHTCLVDRRGEVRGEISAEIIYVRGRVIGPINGVHVQIEAGAHVEGDVTNETISIENGAYVLGSIRHAVPAPGQSPELFNKLEMPENIMLDQITENVRPFKAPKQN